MIASDFRSHLLADAGVSALCEDIFPQTIPDDQGPPAITFSVEADDREVLLEYAESGLKIATFEVRSWSDRYAEAIAIADAIHAALFGHVGDFGADSPPTQVNHIHREGRFDLPFESDSRLYGVQQRFIVAYY